MHYYPFHVGDYRRDTMHLTFVEHGIYRLLLDSYYLNEGPFTQSRDELMRLVRVRTKDEKEAFRRVLEEFFEEIDGAFVNKKCEMVLAKLFSKSGTARDAANARWAKRDADAMRTQCERNATQNPKPNTQDPDIKQSDATASSSGRVPDCPHQAVIDLWHEMLPELPQVVKWTDLRAKLLKARWREIMTDEKLTTVDEGLAWFRKLFRFVKASPFLMGKTASRDGRPFECELEWVLRPNNFVKIIEGKYHAQKN